MIDENQFTYVQNGSGGKKTTPYRCSIRSCQATLQTRKSTGNLVGEVLPAHNHGNQLLRKLAQDTEKTIIDRFSAAEGVKPSTVLQEISNTMLGSNFPGQIASASSAGAIRMKLYRQHQNINPRPKLPSTFEEYMATDIPDKFTQTADGREFLVCKEWISEDEPLVVFLSDWGAEILKTHSTWCFDGTFSSAPRPFKQVKSSLDDALNSPKNVFSLSSQDESIVCNMK